MVTTLASLLEALTEGGFTPEVHGAADAAQRAVTDVAFDSRRVRPGGLFVALRGAAVDGHDYLKNACRAGASALLVEADAALPEGLPPGAAVVRVVNTRRALAHVAAAFYGHPSRELMVIGVTGTNGKTTTTWLLEAILTAAETPVGVIGTLGVRWTGQPQRALNNTTPESLEVQRLLREMADAGVRCVVMEVSSHALMTHRVEGVAFGVGVFTNLSQDHLNFHGTMAAYREAKARLFTRALPASLAWRARAVAVVHTDGDEHGAYMRDAVPEGVELLEWGVEPGPGIRPRRVEMSVGGVAMELETPEGPLPLWSGLLGRLNVENLVGAAATAWAAGVPAAAISAGLAALDQIPGRLEVVAPPEGAEGRPVVVVDYAHTPDAVALAAASLREVTPERLTVLLGCGGDRDPSKRAAMGRAAASHADGVVLTSDNPRSESPEVIIADMEPGLLEAGAAPLSEPRGGRAAAEGEGPWSRSIVSRRRAVAAAIGMAGVGDLVLIAGKGHETTQEIAGVRYPMSDHEEVRLALAHRSGRRVVETLSPEELAAASGGRLVGGAQRRWRDGNAGVTSDSRQVAPGMVFAAIVGERLDGHDYLEQAVERGASMLLVQGERGLARAIEAWRAGGVDGLTLVVEDTVEAMGELGRLVLETIRAVKPWFATVAITGSNGKTTTKELTRELWGAGWLRQERRRVHATPGNFNNLIGLPLTLFELRWGHDVAVLEMGMNAFGEIRRLAAIGEAEARVLTSVTAAHLEGVGDEEGVLRAKGELFEAMRPGDEAVVPAALWARLRAASLLDGAARCAVFGSPEAVAQAGAAGFEGRSVAARRDEAGALTLTVREPERETAVLEVGSPLLGRHNDANLAAALAATWSGARRLGLSAPGRVELAELELPGGRLAVRAGSGPFDGVTLLDDCYNANPGSMRAGVATLVELAKAQGGRAIAVLGDMFELGEQAEALHVEVGRDAAEAGVDAVVGFGALAAGIAAGARALDTQADVRHVADVGGAEVGGVQRVLESLASWASPGDVVLIKGSRGMRMERIVRGMMTPDGSGQGGP